MNTDSTVLISKYLKEYNHIYKEANDIYHEIARKLQLSDSALDIFYTIFEIGDNCLQRDICKASGKKLIQEKLLPLIQIENDTLASFSPEECEQLLRLNAKYNQTLRSRLSNLEEDL